MSDHDLLARRFEADRPRLRAVAHRMLGSAAEADDAVQEAWLRLSRVDTGTVDNLSAWLTTVVGRVCLDMLRSRAVRKEEQWDGRERPPTSVGAPVDPAQAAELADSVGLALLVVLETLNPVERLAFVLHDLFAVPFEEIAPIVGRSPAAARQLASRARRRVQSEPAPTGRDAPTAAPATAAARQRQVVEAFLTASRGGDFGTLLTMLDPEVVLRVDGAGQRLGAAPETRGRDAVARFFSGRARTAVAALVDGAPGAVVPTRRGPRVVMTFIVVDGAILAIEAVADAEVIRGLDLNVG